MSLVLKPRVTIIIPTLNEEQGIKETISRIPHSMKKDSEVLVVDGSSDDDTVIKAREAGARVVIVKRVGKGYAMHEAVKFAQGEILVFIDGDSSYPSEDIPKFVNAVKSNVLVIGNATPFVTGQKTLGEKLELLYPSFLLTRFIFTLFGIPLQDPLNGMRAIIKQDYQRLHLTAQTFEIETEMNVKALAKNMKIIEIPIEKPTITIPSKIVCKK